MITPVFADVLGEADDKVVKPSVVAVDGRVGVGDGVGSDLLEEGGEVVLQLFLEEGNGGLNMPVVFCAPAFFTKFSVPLVDGEGVALGTERFLVVGDEPFMVGPKEKEVVEGGDGSGGVG